LIDDKLTTDLAPRNEVFCLVLPSLLVPFIGAMNTSTKGTPFSVCDLPAENAGDLTHSQLGFSVEHPERQ
jgi:hypothetical protein